MTTRRQKAFVNKDQVDTRILNVEQRTFAYEIFLSRNEYVKYLLRTSRSNCNVT